ncbi:hypothetical protein IAI18_19180 [Acetobacteraceae bacterium H6797]|nr:hypothetical protein [Acetobacteraceae bacterium H6797]
MSGVNGMPDTPDWREDARTQPLPDKAAAYDDDKAKNLAGLAAEKARRLAEEGRDSGVARGHGIAQAVRHIAEDLDTSLPGIARHLRGAADSVDGIADSIKERSVGELVDDVSDFARRQPTAFFGAAILAGFALSRFAKSTASTAASSSPRPPAQGTAPGWAPDPGSGTPRPMTMPAATLGGAAAHRPGDAMPGTMPIYEDPRP